jgi:hypothetical protein
MKKIILLASIVFLLVSCDDKPMEQETPNPFIGTWENESGSFVFTKSVATSYYADGRTYWTGTYTYNDTHIIVKLKWEVPEYEDYPIVETPFLYHFEDDGALNLNGNVIKKVKN